MSNAVRAMVEQAREQGVKLIRPIGCGGFSLLKDGRWFEFKTRRALARWLKNPPGKEGTC